MINSDIIPQHLNLKFNVLCLDFANTVFWRLRENPIEGFSDYTILVKWSQKVGLLTEFKAQHLLQEALKKPDEATLVLDRAITFREAFYRIMLAAVNNHPSEDRDLALLNAELSGLLTKTLIVRADNRFIWGWQDQGNALDKMLWPVFRSAAGLLTSPELNRVGVCKGKGCGWLFYDTSRNHSRKWCDMSDCGNRAKARRFYQRKCTQKSESVSP